MEALRISLDALGDAAWQVLSTRRAAVLPRMPGAAESLLVWGVCRRLRVPVVWIGDGAGTLELRHRDLRTLCPPDMDVERDLLYFPEWESLPTASCDADPDIAGARLSTLMSLQQRGGNHADGRAWVLATCVQGMMQCTVAPGALTGLSLQIKRGGEQDPGRLVDKLVSVGYEPMPQVDQKGQFAVKGGIVDVWTPSEAWPCRIEFLAAEIESIRTFDPLTQRSREMVDSVVLLPGSEGHVTQSDDRDAAETALLDYLPPNSVFVWSDGDSIDEHAAVFEEALREQGAQ
ncbi:MAG: hypothetical protein E4H28_08605, partial [Gemmatimonadales bacterium]